MRHIPLIPLFFSVCLAAEPLVTDWKENHPDWVEAINDDFDGATLNPDLWSRIAMMKGNKFPDWMRYQSKVKKLVQLKDGKATLWGRYGKYSSQNDKKGGKPGYACGSFYSFKKLSFQYGYMEVRAKFDCVQGCWPAIWLIPANQGPKGWPTKGEIDIMEHLNSDSVAYQTLHFSQDNGTGHRSTGTTAGIDKNGYNTYGLLWEKGRITFYINGKITKTIEKQGACWPFDDKGNKFYIIIDQQIGGGWVESSGPIDKNTLEEKGAAFTIDHVILYADPKKMSSPAAGKHPRP